MKQKDFRQMFPKATDHALDLLRKMLAFDPASRITVEEALEHPYLAVWHDASDEPSCPATFDFSFEVVEDIPEMKRMILNEVMRFRQIVRIQDLHSYAGNAGQAQQNVPIPDNTNQWRQEDPRPQEASFGHHSMGLEQELQGGLDAMQH